MFGNNVPSMVQESNQSCRRSATHIAEELKQELNKFEDWLVATNSLPYIYVDDRSANCVVGAVYLAMKEKEKEFNYWLECAEKENEENN